MTSYWFSTLNPTTLITNISTWSTAFLGEAMSIGAILLGITVVFYVIALIIGTFNVVFEKILNRIEGSHAEAEWHPRTRSSVIDLRPKHPLT